MTAFRNIKIFGEPVLRERARPVEVFDKKLLGLINQMFDIMHEAKGIGLAAPQIGHPIRVAVIEIDENRYVLVNPEIIEKSREMEEFEEGCLSLPGVSINIKRPSRIKVAYQDEKGKKNILEADGLLARAIQHEIDHINGVLIIDRATKKERLEALEKFSQFLLEHNLDPTTIKEK